MMDSSQPPLSPETAAKIDALAKQISVAEHLDAEIQAELRGHIEDKVRGYLSGEVRVSEGDAMVLAKAHFGEVRVVKEMFQGVHRKEHATSLARKLAAAIVATMSVTAAVAVVELIWKMFVAYPKAFALGLQSGTSQGLHLVSSAFMLAFEAALLWMIFLFWRWRRRQGRHLWFETWNLFMVGLGVVLAILGLVGVECWVVSIYDASLMNRNYILIFIHDRTYGMIVLGYLLDCMSSAVQAWLWIWWFDRAPRPRLSSSFGLLCWIAAIWFIQCISVGVGYFSVRGEIRFDGAARILSIMRSPQMWTNFNEQALLGLLALILYSSFKRRANSVVVT